MTRMSRDELYISIAELYAKRSTCLRGHVGAVLVRDGRPLGAGYNGAPSGLPQCLEAGCEPVAHTGPDVPDPHHDPDAYVKTLLDRYGCQRAVHAELNAIAWAAREGIRVDGATMYCTYAPCKNCAQAIVAAKIVRFVYRKPYRAERIDILTDADVKVIQLV